MKGCYHCQDLSANEDNKKVRKQGDLVLVPPTPINQYFALGTAHCGILICGLGQCADSGHFGDCCLKDW
jgi:hypothetical protein